MSLIDHSVVSIGTFGVLISRLVVILVGLVFIIWLWEVVIGVFVL
jgi:hypothetical protein